MPASHSFAARLARSAIVAVATLTVVAGCAGPAAVEMADVGATGDAQRAWFEAQASHPRAILLLSPV
jgi:hypothetical protein